MSAGAVVFMLSSWSLVLGVTFWAFRRVLGKAPAPEPEEVAPEPTDRPDGERPE